MKRQFLVALTMMMVPTIAMAHAGAATDPQPAGLGTTGLDQAVAEFDRSCMSLYPNPNRFEYTIAKSDFGYERTDTDEWRSDRAVISRVAKPGAPTECHFDAALSAGDSDRDKIAEAVEDGLRKELGLRPVRVIYAEGIRWDWTMDGKTHSVSYYFGPTVPVRQLALSYRVGR
ncbi:MAG: hypothetical protein Q7T68_15130 [Sphingopyxis sp.]|nr:hypothetical protein [Sphingopyxis sp.]